MAELCLRMRAQMPLLAERVAGAILDSAPEYRGPHVDRDELVASTARYLAAVLDALVEHRDIEDLKSLPTWMATRGRILSGIPIESVLCATEAGYRELWQAMLEEVDPGDGGLAIMMLEVSQFLWAWVQELMRIASLAHRELLRVNQHVSAGTKQFFIERLLAGDLASDAITELAASLGFDRDLTFQAFSVSLSAQNQDQISGSGWAAGLEGTIVATRRGAAAVILVQGVPEHDLVERLAGAASGTAIGIGMLRPGLAGAKQSLECAEYSRVFGETHGAGRVRFADEWPVVLVMVQRARLEALWPEAVRASRDHPYLAESVIAYAGAAFSIAEAARRLHVHPNTMVYRLDRWRQLTGWDPRSYSGLERSMLFLRVRPAAARTDQSLYPKS